MLHNVAFHMGLHCLQRLKQIFMTEMQHMGLHCLQRLKQIFMTEMQHYLEIKYT